MATEIAQKYTDCTNLAIASSAAHSILSMPTEKNVKADSIKAQIIIMAKSITSDHNAIKEEYILIV